MRSALFFSAGAIAGSFGGLLASAIGKMDGVGGKPGWAWIFILEGLATVIIGIASFWMVYDFPDQATFLSPDDRFRVYRRLKEDQQASAEPEEFSWEHVTASLTDWKTYTSSLIYMGCGGGLYAFSLFLPTSKQTSSSVPFLQTSKLYSVNTNALDSSSRTRLSCNHSTTPLRTPLRSRRHPHHHRRCHRRPHTPTRSQRHFHQPPRRQRLRHSPREFLACRKTRRRLSRCHRNIPLHSQHDHMGGQ